MVNCDKAVIGASLVQHIRGDGMIGKLKPLELSKGMYQPAASSYEFKALNYVCSSRLGDKYKTLVVSKQMPAPLPATPALPQQKKAEIEPDKKTISGNKPSHVDISRFAVIY